MTFKEWLHSSYPNPAKHGEWGLGHIISLVIIAAFIIVSTLLLKKRSEKDKRLVLFILAGTILFFELARRIINLCITPNLNLHLVLRILLPRPGCAISCWLVMIAIFVNKKALYNLASIVAILCGGIFFMYPGAGYNNEYILFENLYSIITHCTFFTAAICLVTYGFTSFKYKDCWKEMIGIAIVIIYAFLEIAFKIEADPFFFMQNNEVQEIVGMDYSVFVPCYIAFIIFYINLYYGITFLKDKRKQA